MKNSVVPLLCLSALLVGCESAPDEDEQKIIIPDLKLKTELVLKEPESGSESFVIDVDFTQSSTNDISFDYEFVANTATEDDFIVASGSVELLAGTKSYELPIVVLGDDLDEPDETFSLEISNPVSFEIPKELESVPITIADEDHTPLASFETETLDALEGVGLFRVTVQLSGKSQNEILLPFNYEGLATEDHDYKIISQSPIKVEPGSDSATIEIDFLEDDLPEGGEGIVLSLETPLNALLDKDSIDQILLIIPGDIQVNDTGVATFFDGESFEAISPSSAYPNQDAESGRDVTETNAFDGKLGFSWTKIDASGNALPSSSTDFSCLQDNVTGITWENKQSPQALVPTTSDNVREHVGDAVAASEDDENPTPYPYTDSHKNWRAANYSYYWFNEDKNTNGGHEGASANGVEIFSGRPITNNCAYPQEGSDSYSPDLKYCNTAQYIEAMNSLSLCGYKDWRQPDIDELRSIYDYSYQLEESGYFSTLDKTADYISSSPSADGTGAVWCLEQSTGRAKYCKKQLPHPVIMMRGGAN